MTALTLNFSSIVDKISDHHLELLSRDNPDARLETNSAGQLIFMSPTDTETGGRFAPAIGCPQSRTRISNQTLEQTKQTRKSF